MKKNSPKNIRYRRTVHINILNFDFIDFIKNMFDQNNLCFNSMDFMYNEFYQLMKNRKFTIESLIELFQNSELLPGFIELKNSNSSLNLVIRCIGENPNLHPLAPFLKFQFTCEDLLFLEKLKFNYTELSLYQDLIYNYDDEINQSDTAYFEGMEIPYGTKLTEDFMGDKCIDVSENWGRKEEHLAFEVVAGMKIIFGLAINIIIDIEKFLIFRNSKKNNFFITIDLYNNTENIALIREKQREYWKFLESIDLFGHFEILDKKYSPLDLYYSRRERFKNAKRKK